MSQNQNPPPPAAAGAESVMVVVGCKLPNGLVMEMGRPGDPDHAVVQLAGANAAASTVVGLNGLPFEAGFGLTPVPKSFWDAWHKKHRGLDFVKRGVVFVHADEASARSFARERKDVASGFEALDPSKPIADIEVDQDHMRDGRAQLTQLARANAR